ncbi:MAG: M16 family metallopeptidase [Candidatus Korobacteraceae bacterium]
MNRSAFHTFIYAVFAVVLSLFSSPVMMGQATHIDQIPIPPLPKFDPQEPVRVALPNGMVVFLQPDPELPLISGFARIRGGSRAEPAEKTGMIDIFGSVWRTGGSKARTGDQLDEFLESRAASVETGSSSDSISISFDCLKQDFEPVFAAFLELMREPAFREDKIDLVKRQMYTSISRRNDDIGSIAGREAVKLAYGPDNPYARETEYATVAAVTQQDLLDWHRRYVHPNNMIFGISGDFNAAQMEARLRQAFGSLPRAQIPAEPKIEFRPSKPATYFAPKEDVNQSSVQFVTLGIERKNPDYFAVTVMNEIFGGGFSSRLFSNIRSKLGLAYSVGGGVGSAWDHPGMARISMGTRSESTYEAIQALYKELDNLLQLPITDAELKLAKDSILNSFIFNFDSKDKVLLERMQYEFYGVPPNYLEQYRAAIEKVTAQDVKRVATKYVRPKEFALLVVGAPDPVREELKPLEPIQTIDITIPPPPDEPSEAPAGRPSPSGGQARGE